jgi:hypothetical protein
MKLEQCTWMKIEVAEVQCEGLCNLEEVCGGTLMLWTVAQWEKAFHQDYEAAEDNKHVGRPTILKKEVQLIKMLLEVERHWMTCQLAVNVEITDFSARCIIKDIIGIWKIASHWVPHHLTIMQQWHMHATANLSLEWYHDKGDALVLHHSPWWNLGMGS